MSHTLCSSAWANKVATKRKRFKICSIIFPSKYKIFLFVSSLRYGTVSLIVGFCFFFHPSRCVLGQFDCKELDMQETSTSSLFLQKRGLFK